MSLKGGCVMTNSTIPSTILEQGTEFLTAVVEWAHNLPSITWSDLAGEAAQGRVALFSVDMINGFCHEGVLSSPRVQGIIPAVVESFKGAYAVGVRHFILAQDCHAPESVEFADFPPHCLTGTSETESIPELANLPFANLYTIITKNSLNASHGTQLGTWLEAHRDLSTAVVVGNCTDLCVHQMSMHLKLYANEHNLKMRVIVPENAVQTYDISVAASREIGTLPHNGDILHLLFLYHMRLNGIEVVRFSDITRKDPEKPSQEQEAEEKAA
jgi:nicotinamidase-related amidase